MDDDLDAPRVRRRYQHRPALDPLGPFWQGYRWSSWYAFPDLLGEGLVAVGTACGGPGIYRFAVPRRRGLLYIGQAGAIRRRLAGHARAVRDILGPGRRPHLGFHHELAAHIERGGSVRVSWISLDGMDKGDRLGIECDLISAHRTIVGANPAWQFLPIGGADVDS